MFRRMFVAAAAVVFVAFGVIAGEHKGAITKYEAGKSLTLKSKDGEKGVYGVVITNDKDEVTEIKAGEKKAK